MEYRSGEITLSRAKGLGQWRQIRRLYKKAFPQAERKPFGIIFKMARQGRSDVWVIRQDGAFAGFGATINGPELVLLDYFAVDPALRGKGVGSGALRDLMDQYRDRGFFVEIEGTWEPGEDLAVRQRRKRFYQAAGMKELSVRAEVFGVRMELLGVRCSLDFEGYRAFYRERYDPWAAEHIAPVSGEL